jgi:hypothetical protein
MKYAISLVMAAAGLLALGVAQTKTNPFVGRWDITVTTGRGAYPDWMEIKQTPSGFTALIQPRSGSAFTAAAVKPEGDKLVINPRGTANWEFTSEGDRLTGTARQGDDGVQARLAAVRAPLLDRPAPKAWNAPEPIFNGKDLTGWEPMTPQNSHWAVQNGDLLNESKGSNLRTTRTFNDFKLHIEFNCPSGGNSGIYLRGRYEVQVEYEPLDANDKFHRIGSIYSFIAPSVELPRKPGTWETYDITLVGRRVTVVRDGVKTIDNQEIPGITGGALDSHEGEPGPFYIQGDHTGGMRYRNITVQLPK